MILFLWLKTGIFQQDFYWVGNLKKVWFLENDKSILWPISTQQEVHVWMYFRYRETLKIACFKVNLFEYFPIETFLEEQIIVKKNINFDSRIMIRVPYQTH